MSELCDIAMIGLAVMGENLSANFENHGYSVAVYDRDAPVLDRFMSGRGKGRRFVGCPTLEELVKNLSRPRKIMMMIKAGQPVDDVTEKLIPLLSPGDIIVDGGNSH